MTIRDCSIQELRRMRGQEGLVLQGCGGDPQEWVTGINQMLTQEGILLNSRQFETVLRFQRNGLTCLCFPFREIELDMGKLALWRLETHDLCGGTWLSDYVPNRLGGFLEEPAIQRPDCALIGEDGNIFNLVGIASRTLKEVGQPDQAQEMAQRVFASGSYEEALGILGEYVNIVSREDLRQNAPNQYQNRGGKAR